MATERMFGLETEYAFAALGPNGERLDQAAALGRLMGLAAARWPHLPDKQSHGFFLQTGGRFYRDAGNHPELTTPEVVNPWDLCRYLIAGDRMLAGLAAELSGSGGIAQVLLSRSGVGYGGAPTTWACHESYCHNISSGLSTHLIPHLVTRIVYTGAGGFDNRSPGLEFLISPRVAHLVQVSSGSSQSGRGIYHTKDESLSAPGFHRLHVLCGESVCSETANWLKLGTTALVVAMIEAGLTPGRTVRPADPLAAMQTLAADPACRAEVGCRDSRQRTAVAIQRAYLEQAETHTASPFMPPWTAEVCTRWRQTLDRIEAGPEHVAGTLDWAIKLPVFRRYAARMGVAWESLPTWNLALRKLAETLHARSDREAGRLSTAIQVTSEVLSRRSPVADVVAHLTPLLREHGLAWDGLEAVLSLRTRLFEIDTRFSQLGEGGIFASLDRAGVLDHHVPGVDNIEHAMENPPALGRARLRGLCVQRFAHRRNEYSCTWKGIWDEKHGRYLDLTQPFETEERWRDESAPTPDRLWRERERLSEAMRRGMEFYDRGDYEQAHQLLEYVCLRSFVLDADGRLKSLRIHALVQGRRGRLDAVAGLDELAGERRPTLAQIVDYVCVHRFAGLVPAPGTAGWIQRGLVQLAAFPDDEPAAAAAFREHYGYWLMTEERLNDARDVLESVCRLRPEAVPSRIRLRSLAALAEVHRRQGRPDEARRLLDEAAAPRYRRHEGDHAEFVLTERARLEIDRNRGLAHLEEARAVQTALHHGMGEARTVLLQLRLCSDPNTAAALTERLTHLRERLPALAHCRLMTRLCGHLETWTGGGPAMEEGEEFYCGV